MKWIKKAARDKAVEMLNKDYKETSDVIKNELQSVMDQFNDLKITLYNREKELIKAYSTINKQEVIISEL